MTPLAMAAIGAAAFIVLGAGLAVGCMAMGKGNDELRAQRIREHEDQAIGLTEPPAPSPGAQAPGKGPARDEPPTPAPGHQPKVHPRHGARIWTIRKYEDGAVLYQEPGTKPVTLYDPARDWSRAASNELGLP